MTIKVWLGLASWMIAPLALAAYDDAGTDYSTSPLVTYVEDSSNRATQFASIFSCVMSRSGTGLPGFANKTWFSLVNEVECDYGDADDSRAGSILTESIVTSSMAAAGSPQEVSAWMTFANGDRGIFTSSITASPATLPPWGEFYSGWYRTDRPWEGSDSDNYPYETNMVETAFADIRQVGSDVVAVTAYTIDPDPSEDSTIVSKITAVDGDPDTFRYIVDLSDDGTREVETGQTNADFLYRAEINPATGSVVPGTGQCVSRNNVWIDQWDMALYNFDDGSLVELENPGFNFRSADGTVRGAAREGDFWFNDDYELTPDTAMLDVVRSTDDAAFSIVWAPGNMRSEIVDTITPADGVIFRKWIDGSEVSLVWDKTNKKFTYGSGSEIVQADHSQENPLYLRSDLYNGSLEWFGADAENSGTAFERRVWGEIGADHPLLQANAATKFYCFGPYSCPHHQDGGDTKITLSEWLADGRDVLTPDIGTANWDEQYTYFLTPLVGSGDYMPATLYFDKDGDGLDASDSPVYVDFKGKYQHPTHFGGDWDETPTTSLEGTYPSIWANLVLASEIDSGDCSVNDYWSCPTRATWDSSAFRWNRGYYLLDSDNAVYAFSPAIFATFTNDAATDANANAQNMTVTVAEGDWNDLLGEQCATSGGCEVAMDLSLLDGQPIRVRYDGQRVNWLPGMRDSARDEWFRIVNPADGTVVTDTDGNRYVLKTLGSDQLLIGESDTSTCQDAGLVFSGLLDGHTLDDLPDVWDNDNYPRPALVWSDQPELPDGYCTVQDGVSDCD